MKHLAVTDTGTTCTFNAPYLEDFNAASSKPECWSLYNGLASDAFAGINPASATSGWVFTSTYVFGQYHPKLNIYGTSRKHWLVSPAINLSGLNNPTLTFDLALTAYGNANPISNPAGQADDKFMVIISTDNGATWSAANATVWSNDSAAEHVFNEIPNTGEEITIPLTSYANTTIMIAFYGESTVSNGANDLHIDNVRVIEAASCPKPTQLAVTGRTSNSVTLGWNEAGSATTWNIQYGPVGFTPDSIGATTVIASTNPFTVNNLASGTYYDFYVQADCGNDQSPWAGPVTTNTLMSPTALPYTTNFAAGSDQDWLLNNGSCTNFWTINTLNSGSGLFVTTNGTEAGYNVNSPSTVTAEKLFTVGDAPEFLISFDVNVGGESTFDYLKVFFAPADSNYAASTTSTTYANNNYSTHAVNFADYASYSTHSAAANNPYKFNLTDNNTVHVTVEMPNPNADAVAASTAKLVFLWRNDNSGGTQPGAILSNVEVKVYSCHTPTELAVSNITYNSADITWTPGGSESAWTVEYKQAGATTWTSVTTNTASYTIGNLNASTQYDVRLKADCSSDDSSPWTTANFQTANTPVIGVTTTAATDITYSAATLNATISNPDNATLTSKGFEWKTANGSTYMHVTGTGTGNTFSASLDDLAPNTEYTYKAFVVFDGNAIYGDEKTFTTLAAPCGVPTGLHHTNIQNESITVEWDAADGVNIWKVRYRTQNGTWNTLLSNMNNLQITGLTGNTTYEIQVQANCGSGNLSDWSESITATTTDVGIEEYLSNSIVLFPNPAKEVINVQCTMNNVQSVEVIDVYGKVINSLNVTENPTRINISGLANGMYFVRVTTDMGVVTKTFVKR